MDKFEFELLFSVMKTFCVYRVKKYSAVCDELVYYDFLWYVKM